MKAIHYTKTMKNVDTLSLKLHLIPYVKVLINTGNQPVPSDDQLKAIICVLTSMKITLSDPIFNDNKYDSISLEKESVPINMHSINQDDKDRLENIYYIEIEEEPLEMSKDSQNLHTFKDLHTLKKDIQKVISNKKRNLIKDYMIQH